MLLSLGAQTVGDEDEVHLFVAAQLACRRELVEVILEDLLGIEQHPADERALAVVDAAGGRHAQQVALAYESGH